MKEVFVVTSVDRIRNALHFEQTDRIPVIPEIIQHALEIAGVKHGSYSTNPQVLANTALSSLDYYGYDGVYVSTDNYIICEAMGGLVRFPEDAPPQLLHPALCNADLNSLKKLTPQSGRIPVILEATRLCRERVGDRVFVKTNIDSAPFSAAASVCGTEEFMIALYEDEKMALKLIGICTESVIAYGKAAAAAGAHGLAFGDSVAGLLGREMYERFALPYAKIAIAELKQTGLPVFYHVCGNTTHLSDLLVETGADCVEIDSMVPMAKMQAIAAGRCALEGNVSTVEALLQGTPEDVRQESRSIIELFGNQGGLILSSACEVPRFSPRENVEAMVRAAKEYNH